jgi:hypothetical protein
MTIFTYKGRKLFIRPIGQDYFTEATWFGLSIDDSTKLTLHGDSVSELRQKAAQIIDAAKQ